MTHIRRAPAALGAVALLLAASPPSAVPPGVSKVLDLFRQLQIAQRHQAQKKPVDRIQFTLTESEVNDYARYALSAKPRPGVQSLVLKIFPQNYYSTFSIIDFDAVERWKPGTIPLLLKPVLSGRRSIWVDYRVRSRDGVATFTVEKARFEGIPLPAFFVQKMIEVVGARQPEHYNMSKPVPLPFGLRNVWTGERVVMGEN
jgi:hypothetical protein